MANSIRDYADGVEDVDEMTDDPVTFNIKFLGSVSIDQNEEQEEKEKEKEKDKKKKIKSRSDEVTSSAIKKIITNSKNNKKLDRVSLAISPKGIETFDPVTGETINQISIYKISYCSVDANFKDVFAFVSSNIDKELNMKTTEFSGMPSTSASSSSSTISANKDEEKLVCYAFMCPKRKVAQKMALTVARAFERAYQIWQNQEFQRERKQIKSLEAMNKENTQTFNSFDKIEDCDENGRSLLIDFSSDSTTTELCFKGNKEYLQNTWVSLKSS